MGIFDKLGGTLIANTIKSNVLKAIDSYIESSVINSLLPHAPEGGTKSLLNLAAELNVSIADCVIQYTQHMGKKDEAKTLQIPLTEKHLSLNSNIPVIRPGKMAASQTLTAANLNIVFTGSLGGIAYQEMMMGAGATIDSVTLKLTVSGNAGGTWIASAEALPESAEVKKA